MGIVGKMIMTSWVEVKDRVLDKSLKGEVQCLDAVESRDEGKPPFIVFTDYMSNLPI